jgi:hypothetical protein
VHNLPECDKPVVAGWQFSTVVVVPPKTSSHTYIVSNRRIPTAQTPAQVAIEQLTALRAYFGERPINLGDRYYPTKDFLVKVSPDYDLLLRPRANRVFYRAVVTQTQAAKPRRGAPAKHGTRFACNDPVTHHPPDQEWLGRDEQGHKLQVSAWQELHLREAPQLSLSVIRVQRSGASGKKRDPVISWFVWAGQTKLELSEVWPTYKRRYSIEHGFRFDKQDLLWTQPRVRYPAQFELWTSLVSIAHDQLHLAEALGLQTLRPWESKARPPSPQQIRRGLGRIMGQLGSPAKAVKSRGKGHGRAVGAKVGAAPRYSVVKKGFRPAKTT